MFKVGDIIIPDKAKTFKTSQDWYSGSAPIKDFDKAEVVQLCNKSEVRVKLIGGKYGGNRPVVKINNSRFKLENCEDSYEIY